MSTTFQLFSVTHLLALSAIAAATALLCRHGPRRPAQARPARFEIGLALLNLFVWVMAHAYWMLPPQFEARTSLPLQLCHLAALAASASLVTGQRVFQALALMTVPWTLVRQRSRAG